MVALRGALNYLTLTLTSTIRFISESTGRVLSIEILMASQFEPRDPDFKARVAQSFAQQSIMQTIGASLLDVIAGQVEIELPFDQRLTQQDGFIHAGVSATIMDSACGYAALSLMPENARVLSIEFKINLLAPAAGDRFVAVGKVIKPGRSVFVAEAQLFASSRDSRQLVATMGATLMALIADD